MQSGAPCNALGLRNAEAVPVAVRMQLIQLPSLICCAKVASGSQALDDKWHLPHRACLAFFQGHLQDMLMRTTSRQDQELARYAKMCCTHTHACARVAFCNWYPF